MGKPSRLDYYTLLGGFLSPSSSERLRRRSAEFARSDPKPSVLGPLLALGNEHSCVPMWFSQLRRSGLLADMPFEVQAYLEHGHRQNCERNAKLRRALIMLLQALSDRGVPSVLLKGAATFADDLYDDDGARVMLDLDVLVPENELTECGAVVSALGYEEFEGERMEAEGLATDERIQHLPGFYNRETEILLEIHYRPAYAGGGRMLASPRGWVRSQPTSVDGYTTATLCPTDRLILNTWHALVPHREFVLGNVSLLQLAEFCTLVARYGSEIDWDDWRAAAREQGVETEFLTYLSLADELMGCKHPYLREVAGARVSLHRWRIKAVGNSLRGLGEAPLRGSDLLLSRLFRGYYFASLPQWVWKNRCYVPDGARLPLRIYVMGRQLFKASSWKKV